MRLLFMGGPARSGTTALADYLNLHDEVLLCRERYKYVSEKVNPEFFTFDKILDYEPQLRSGETNIPREYHVELLAKKDPARLKWIGDKHPGYVRSLRVLSENNPGAKFILTYRPLEEVAESLDARSKDPEDTWLGGRNGFELGIRHWNRAMQCTRQFIESSLNPDVLIVSYHDFFYTNEVYIPLLSRFLELEFDESVRQAWRKFSQEFESKRREKNPLNDRQRSLIEENKDWKAEQWVLGRIERQWTEPAIYTGRIQATAKKFTSLEATRQQDHRQARTLRVEQLEQRLATSKRRTRKLERCLAEESRRAEALKGRNVQLTQRIESLEHQLQSIKTSRSWRFLMGFGRIKARLLGKR